MIEKHLTLDRTMAGPDHAASIEPAEFKAMVAGIRQVERALGDGDKAPTPSEKKTMPVARKSLVARTPIRSGEAFDQPTISRSSGPAPACRRCCSGTSSAAAPRATMKPTSRSPSAVGEKR